MWLQLDHLAVRHFESASAIFSSIINPNLLQAGTLNSLKRLAISGEY